MDRVLCGSRYLFLPHEVEYSMYEEGPLGFAGT